MRFYADFKLFRVCTYYYFENRLIFLSPKSYTIVLNYEFIIFWQQYIFTFFLQPSKLNDIFNFLERKTLFSDFLIGKIVDSPIFEFIRYFISNCLVQQLPFIRTVILVSVSNTLMCALSVVTSTCMLNALEKSSSAINHATLRSVKS
jgi:hypothetical protein